MYERRRQRRRHNRGTRGGRRDRTQTTERSGRLSEQPSVPDPWKFRKVYSKLCLKSCCPDSDDKDLSHPKIKFREHSKKIMVLNLDCFDSLEVFSRHHNLGHSLYFWRCIQLVTLLCSTELWEFSIRAYLHFCRF